MWIWLICSLFLGEDTALSSEFRQGAAPPRVPEKCLEVAGRKIAAALIQPGVSEDLVRLVLGPPDSCSGSGGAHENGYHRLHMMVMYRDFENRVILVLFYPIK
jgi:hypothetical protein